MGPGMRSTGSGTLKYDAPARFASRLRHSYSSSDEKSQCAVTLHQHRQDVKRNGRRKQDVAVRGNQKAIKCVRRHAKMKGKHALSRL